MRTVCVWPPLFWSPAGSNPAGVFGKSPGWLNPQVFVFSRLFPCEVSVPVQLLGVLFATIVLRTVIGSVPAQVMPPAPGGLVAVFWVMVTLSIEEVTGPPTQPASKIAPNAPWFPHNV